VRGVAGVTGAVATFDGAFVMMRRCTSSLEPHVKH
jgi:hypothetical protein